MRIGELLIMNGLITTEQLELAMEVQQRSPAKLGEIMIDKGYINERQLAEALEFQLGVPVVKMLETVFDSSAVHLIPESLARKYSVLPVSRDGGRLRVAMLDPLNHEAVKQIQMVSGLSVLPMLAIRSEMEEAIVRHYGSDESSEELKGILQAGIEQKASAIHLEAAEHGLTVRFRLGNSLQEHGQVAKFMEPYLIERIKRLARLEARERSVPQSGRYQTDVDHRPIEVRVSTLPTLHGESVHLQLTDPYSPLMKLSELDLGADLLREIEQALNHPEGLLIVSGPPTAGKTSTAYSLLENKQSNKWKIMSIEDPIERVMPGITQVEVNDQSGLTMPRALRAALSHKPDVIMVDGMSDTDTAEMALRAARFGLMVVGTILARNAFDTLGRLIAMVRDTDQLASSLSCVISQRLARRVCQQCAQTMPATAEEISRLEAVVPREDSKNAVKGSIGNFRSFVFTQTSGKPAVIRGTGCRACSETGYRGYVALQEVLTIDGPIRERIAGRSSILEIEKYALQSGHKSLLYDGLVKAQEGLTTVEEALKATI